MKIAFVCSSLEPGKDGVGDYSRRLASECRTKGHLTLLVGLNDHWIHGEAGQETGGELRFPSAQDWSSRINHFNARMAEWLPDIVSLQLVPFGLGHRGIIGNQFDEMRVPCRWHIMFHELWLGVLGWSGAKHWLWGRIQRWRILRLVKKLSPIRMHTQTATYRWALARCGLRAESLPLFANIEIADRPDFAWIYQKLSGSLTAETRAASRVLVFFGSLHPEWDPESLLSKIDGAQPILLAVGRLGGPGESRWKAFAEKYAGKVNFLHWGEMPAKDISAVLQFADAGVAVSPWGLIEKSGTASAMIEHGLPVIVTRNDVGFPPGLRPAPDWDVRLFPIWEDGFSWQKIQRIAPRSRLAGIARKFIDDLEMEAT